MITLRSNTTGQIIACLSLSELKKKKGGDLPPNSRETWLDTQARALSQAARRVLKGVN